MSALKVPLALLLLVRFALTLSSPPRVAPLFVFTTGAIAEQIALFFSAPVSR